MRVLTGSRRPISGAIRSDPDAPNVGRKVLKATWRRSRLVTDPIVEERPASTWSDAFPWLEATADRPSDTSSEPWWRERIDRPGSVLRVRRLAAVSDLALSRLTRWQFGQLFPALRPDLRLDALDLPARARHALFRAGLATTEDLATWRLDELLDMRNVGVGTIFELLRRLADAATTSAAPTVLATEPRSPDTAATSNTSRPHLAQYTADMLSVARWNALIGTPARPLIGAPLPAWAPTEITEARIRIDAVTATDFLDSSEGPTAAALFEATFQRLDERAQVILSHRLFADRPATHEDLGSRLGLTRERVRQIEAKARATLVEGLRSGGRLELLASAVRSLIDPVFPLNDLLEAFPVLAATIEVIDQPGWRVLDRLDDRYEIEDGWCACPSLAAARVETAGRLQELADAYGVVRLADLPPLNDRQDALRHEATLRSWLCDCGWAVDGEVVFTRTRALNDRAAALLSVTGAPLSSQSILERIGGDRSLGSLKNAMAADERIERVDRDSWGLREWGLARYQGIRALIREEVTRSGGHLPLEDLIERLTGRYTISANSVVSYASAAPFEVHDGVVRLATAERKRKRPEDTRRLYRRGESWLYRIRVTKEHLRGSGSMAPVAVATALGLREGESRQLSSPLGVQTVSWLGPQPAFGTIRRFLIAADIETDTEVFLVLGNHGSFNIEPVDDDVADQLGKALLLAGCRPDTRDEDACAALAQAIGLPPDTPPVSVIGSYRERGDEDIAELLISVRDRLGKATRRTQDTADVDEILDLLL